MFSTGQFSKIAQVSKRLLQYYDDIGLFVPARTEQPSGARYYAAEQLPELFQILALKDLGLRLDQIRSMVKDGLSSAEIHEMLVAQKAQIHSRLEREQLRLRAVESRLRSFRAAQDSQGDLIVKQIPEQLALTMRSQCDSMDDVMGLIGELVAEVPKRVGKAAGPIFGVNHCNGYEMDDIDLQTGVFLNFPTDGAIDLPSGRVLEPTVLPAVGAMVCSVRMQSVEDTHRSFAALGLWMERTGHRMAGPSREIFLKPPSPEGIAVIETQFPIEPIVEEE